MDWRDKLKCIVGVTDEKDIADLTDMEEREILDTKHLHNMEIVRKLKRDRILRIKILVYNMKLSMEF